MCIVCGGTPLPNQSASAVAGIVGVVGPTVVRRPQTIQKIQPRCPAGIFIELSMKSFGARVPARKKYLFQGCRGPWLLHKLLPGTAKKNQEGDAEEFLDGMEQVDA